MHFISIMHTSLLWNKVKQPPSLSPSKQHHHLLEQCQSQSFFSFKCSPRGISGAGSLYWIGHSLAESLTHGGIRDANGSFHPLLARTKKITSTKVSWGLKLNDYASENDTGVIQRVTPSFVHQNKIVWRSQSSKSHHGDYRSPYWHNKTHGAQSNHEPTTSKLRRQASPRPKTKRL